MRIYLWLYEEGSVFNLVLVIKDQGYALTIDYIKKKQTDPSVSQEKTNGPWCLLIQRDNNLFL